MNLTLFDSRPTQRQADLSLLMIRVMAGIIFMVHGWQKVSMGLEGVAGFFGQAGAPFPALAAPLVTYLELVGGAALILGLLTRPVAAMLAVDMFM
ncbi:MAG: DoxX family protein, partial [Gemmatimonadaceae bacterium]